MLGLAADQLELMHRKAFRGAGRADDQADIPGLMRSRNISRFEFIRRGDEMVQTCAIVPDAECADSIHIPVDDMPVRHPVHLKSRKQPFL